MALVFLSLTECILCNEVIDASRPFVGFPPFTGNTKDPLYRFSDSAVHESCLQHHPSCQQVRSILDAYDASLPSRGGVCAVDGELITDSHHFLSFGLLTSDPQEELYRFNFLTLNRMNIGDWADRDAFIRTATAFLDAGKWEGTTKFNALAYLVLQVQKVY
nr:hypothetical protein [uncultured Chitinophaga sp.]